MLNCIRKLITDFYIIISTMRMVLILFLPLLAFIAWMPPVNTTYLIPEANIQLGLSERYQLFNNGKSYIQGEYSLASGVNNRLNLRFSSRYIHRGGENGAALGDSYVSLWCYGGEIPFLRGSWGMDTRFLLPTGEDVYKKKEWQNLSFGNNEIRIGPVFSFDLNQNIIFVNIFYNLREAEDESFYKGLTRENAFGLNLSSKDAFWHRDRLKNDYITTSIAMNNRVFYPLIINCGVYHSRALSDSEDVQLSIEGAGENSLYLFLGGRYFLTEGVFLGFVYREYLNKNKDYFDRIIHMDFVSEF